MILNFAEITHPELLDDDILVDEYGNAEEDDEDFDALCLECDDDDFYLS